MEQHRDRERFAEHVMRQIESPHHQGNAARPTHRHRAENPLCGDRVRIELVVDRTGLIVEAWFEASGCLICRAAASLLTARVEGLPLAEAARFRAADMLDLFSFPLTTGHQNCALLPWRVLQVAIVSPIQPP